MLGPRTGALVIFCVVLLLSVSAANAQTLTSITVCTPVGSSSCNTAPFSLSTGAFAGLTAMGHYSDGSTQQNILVTWSSSDQASATVNNVGVVTGISGTVNPVTITATSGTVSGTAQITSVTPQTTMFASDGSNLSVYDITFHQAPSLVTTVSNYAQLTDGGENGQTSLPMAIGPGPNSTQQYLFIANPAYQTTNVADFVVTVIDTTTYKVVGTINTGLCYPTSLAVAALSPSNATTAGNNYLYVVNAGPSVAQNTAVSCSGANVQYYDISQATSATWSPAGTLTASDLESGSGVSGAVPLVVAASSDQSDGLVYVGSTANYSNAGTGTGLLTAVQTGTTTVASASDLNFSDTTGKYAISPIGLTVVTAYPTWAGGPVHTALMTGPGYNTFTHSTITVGTMYYYVSDACNSTSCATEPQCVFCASNSYGPSSYLPWELATSPDGLNVYATNDTWYLDQLVSTDGTSSTGFFVSNFFTTAGTNIDNCSASVCLPITSIATNADESNAFVGFIGQINRLDPSSLASSNQISNVSPLSLAITQSPELELTISQTGLVVTGSFQVNGNFQNLYASLAARRRATANKTARSHANVKANTEGSYPFQCDWGQGIVWSASLGIGPTGGTVTPGITPTYSAGAVSIVPAAQADANGNGSSIINPIPVGPITAQIAATSSSVPLGGSDQFSWQVSNATDQTVVWQVNSCTPGDQSCPWGYVSTTPPNNGVYFAPTSLPSGSVQVVAIPNADTAAPSNQLTLTLLTPTARPNPTSLTFSAQNVGTTSASQKVTVTNTGGANLVLAATPVTFTGADPGDFATASGTTCTANLSIAAGANCIIEVAFTPGAVGTRTANLVVTDNSGGISGSTQSVSLTGMGQQLIPTAQVSPSSLTFSAQNIGTTSASQKVTVTNIGTANLVLGATPVSFSGANPSDFATASGTTCTASLSIAPSANCIIEVVFTPATSGTLAANLVVTDNSGGISGSTQMVSLSGTGQIPGTGTASLNPTSLTFSPQNVGTTSASQKVTVTNTGTANLVLAATPISFTGADPTEFATATGTTCTANLSMAPNSTCAIEITFTPAAAGTRTANLVLTDNSGGTSGSTQSVPLSGTGQQLTGTASVSPLSLTFSTQNVGTTSSPQKVTVTNTGQANLALGATPLSFTGASSDYAIASGTTCTANLSIAPNANCIIQVTFSPLAAGTLTASLVITDNSGGTAGATQTVSLTGTGFQPTTVTIYPANPAVEAGATQQFTPNFTPSSAAGPVTWSVSGSGCGGQVCGSIDQTGLYTAPSTLAAVATDTVTVTLNSNTSVTASTPVDLYLKPTLTTSSQSQTVTAGQAATYNLVLSPGTGDTAATLTVECHQNTLPTGVSCPQVLVQPSSTGATFNFVIDTTAGQSAALLNRGWLSLNLAFVMPAYVLISFAPRGKGKHQNRLLALLGVFLLFVLVLGLNACGTSGTFGQTTQKNFGGTPPGTYSIEIDGVGPSGIPESIGTVSLTVQ